MGSKRGTAGGGEREVRELRARLAEAEGTVRAIRQGEVDAFVVEGADGEPRVYTLEGADHVYRVAVETMAAGAVTLTTQGLILYSNRRFAELLRTPLKDVIGARFQAFVGSDSRPLFEGLLASSVRKQASGELLLTAADGTSVPVQASLRALGLDQPIVGLVMMDLTERKRMEESARTAVVEERTRMAREIHDTLAQGLTGIAIQLDAAEDAFTEEPEAARAHILRARTLARESLREARRAIWAMRPRTLEERDLYTALVQVVGQLTREPPIRIELSRDGIPRPLGPESEDNLLRITQEALANSLRHARASLIRVTLTYGAQQVQLCVEDDGEGFDPMAGPHRHFGLHSMRERAKSLGGQLTVASQPGQGTRIVAVVPLPDPEGASSAEDGTD